jgi:hypothetical protein
LGRRSPHAAGGGGADVADDARPSVIDITADDGRGADARFGETDFIV